MWNAVRKCILTVVCLSMACMLLISCGKQEPAQEDTVADTVGIIAEERYIAGSVTELEERYSDCQYVMEHGFFFRGDKIVQLCEIQEDSGEKQIVIIRREVEDPAQHDTVLVDLGSLYDVAEEPGQTEPSVIRMKIASDGEIYCTLNVENRFYMVQITDETVSIVAELEEDLADCEFDVRPDGKLYCYTPRSTQVYCLDPVSREKTVIRATYPIQTIAYDEIHNEAIMLEADGSKCVIESENGEQNYWDDEMISPYGMSLACDSKTGQCYSSDVTGIYTDAECIYDFIGNAYIIDHIDAFRVTDGVYELVVCMNDDYYYVKLYEGVIRNTKKELTLATGYINVNLQLAVARFNRSNDEYYITICQMEDWSEHSGYMDEIHRQLTGGDGPDIYTDDALQNVTEYIENGYIRPVTCPIDRERFQRGCMDGLSVDGVLYGVPYDCKLRTICYPSSFAQSGDRLNVSQFMAMVESTNAEIVACGMDGIDIIIHFFLSDNANTTYIDWEKGVSHLNESSFRNALEFAKKYADTSGTETEEASYLKQGKSVAMVCSIDALQEMNYLEAAFQGKPYVGGYPCVDGNGTYIEVRALYGSSSTEHPEGVDAFMEFVVQDSVQMQSVDWDMPISGVIGNVPQFPVVLSAMEYLIGKDRYCRYVTSYQMGNGVRYNEKDLSQQQVDLFRSLYGNAACYSWNIDQVYDLIEEELDPYYEGDKSAEEVAGILHNRIQLYLDEHK